MKVGRRLAIKILNASKFALGVMGDDVHPGAPTRSPSRSTGRCSRRLAALVDERDRRRSTATTTRARSSHRAVLLGLLRRLPRAGEEPRLRRVPTRRVAQALAVALDTLLRLFAPHLPFVTEEVWSWWRDGSVHRASWPSVDELAAFAADDLAVYPAAAAVLGEIRKAKSTAQALDAHRGHRRDRARAGRGARARSTPALDDVREAGRVVGELELVEAGGARGRGRRSSIPSDAWTRVRRAPGSTPRQPRDRRRRARARRRRQAPAPRSSGSAR